MLVLLLLLSLLAMLLLLPSLLLLLMLGIPNRADLGPTWDRSLGRRQDRPLWWMIRGRRPG